VRNAEGVWLASDTLVIHNDGQRFTSSHGCKVVISHGQIFFNMGFFKDVKLLVSQEEKLPFDSIDNTQKAILELLKTNHMDLSRDPKHTPNQMIVNTGILQVENSVYRARMVGQTDDLRPMDRYVKEFKMGIPHGYGDAVERVRHAAADDPAVAERIAKNPKQELLKILGEESIMRNDEVQGPFTVLLLHPDGTVSDYSDESFCTIPDSAKHLDRTTESGPTPK
jgi:hypothetical protein